MNQCRRDLECVVTECLHTSTSVVYKAKGKKPTLIYVLVLYSVAERGQKVFCKTFFIQILLTGLLLAKI